MKRMHCIAATVSSFLLVAAQSVSAAPIKPADPNSGWLFDEQYGSLGTVVTDSFGSLDGVTKGNFQATAGPQSSSDTPFNYTGNMSLSTVNGPTDTGGSNGTYWHTEFPTQSWRNLMNGASAVSVQAWVKYDAGTTMVNETVLMAGHRNNQYTGVFLAIGGPNSATPNRVQVGGRSQRVDATTDAYQLFHSTATLIPGQWNHIVGVVDYANDEIRIAINGGDFETASVNFSLTSVMPGAGTSTPDFLSGRSSGSRFIGLMDEAAIWTSALTQDNVAWLYNNSLMSVPEPGSIMLACIGLIGLGWSVRRRGN